MKQGWLRRLWRFLRPHAPALAAAAALAAASGLLALLVPLFSGWAVGAVGTEAGWISAVWRSGAPERPWLRRCLPSLRTEPRPC